MELWPEWDCAPDELRFRSFLPSASVQHGFVLFCFRVGWQLWRGVACGGRVGCALGGGLGGIFGHRWRRIGPRVHCSYSVNDAHPCLESVSHAGPPSFRNNVQTPLRTISVGRLAVKSLSFSARKRHLLVHTGPHALTSVHKPNISLFFYDCRVECPVCMGHVQSVAL